MQTVFVGKSRFQISDADDPGRPLERDAGRDFGFPAEHRRQCGVAAGIDQGVRTQRVTLVIGGELDLPFAVLVHCCQCLGAAEDLQCGLGGRDFIGDAYEC